MKGFKTITLAMGLSMAFCNAAWSKDISSTLSFDCLANPAWFKLPTLPKEVAKNAEGNSDFCDFYQFAWQSFLYTMSPNAQGNYTFTDSAQFRELEIDSNGIPLDSCDAIQSASLPKRIAQSEGVNIYDQNGNVIFYDIRFSANMCNTDKLLQQQNFAEKGENKIHHVTTLKAAWRILTLFDNPDNYVVIETTIEDVKHTDLNAALHCLDSSEDDCLQLGLVGFHNVHYTPDHPEGVWSTFEHNSNAPECQSIDQSVIGWSFASASSTEAINKSNTLGWVQSRPDASGSLRKATREAKAAIKRVLKSQFNEPPSNQFALTGKPTNICIEYPQGSDSAHHGYDRNYTAGMTLNRNVQKYTQGDFEALSHYYNVGVLWLGDSTQDSISKNPRVLATNNQHGSLALANTTLETDMQNIDPNQNGSLIYSRQPVINNCLGCHSFNGTASYNNNNVQLSAEGKFNATNHAFAKVIKGKGIIKNGFFKHRGIH